MTARRQFSLRVRLLAGLLSTTLVVLVGFDLVVSDAMRAYLVNRVDKTLTIAQRLVVNRSEVGRLAAALNAMLERIESSVAQRDLAQARMRTFMADASHELRTPLTTVRAYAELYEQGALCDKDALDQALRRISSEATRMSDLVRQMLALARSAEYPAEAVEPVDLTALASELVRDVRITNPQRTWTLRDPGRPVVVLGDPTRLRQVLSSLLLNVLVHSSPTAEAAVSVAVSGASALIEVTDAGPGVPPEALGHLFDRFFRADVAEPHRGSGLGLAIVAAIAEAHGGHVVASAAEPTGLTITVTLPLLPTS